MDTHTRKLGIQLSLEYICIRNQKYSFIHNPLEWGNTYKLHTHTYGIVAWEIHMSLDYSCTGNTAACELLLRVWQPWYDSNGCVHIDLEYIHFIPPNTVNRTGAMAGLAGHHPFLCFAFLVKNP